jgi:peptide/nickel transport system substrate-binding protein
MGRLFAILFISFLATGCSDKPTDDINFGAVGEPAYGATYVAASIGEASTLIPWIATDSASHAIAGMIYPTLLRYDRNLSLAPYLAESWNVSDDGLTLSFTLRQNARWEDGTPVTSADVLASFERIIAPDTQTPYAAKYKMVAAAAAPGSHTFTVRYDAPFAPALASWAGLSILPAHVLATCPDLMTCPLRRAPMGTGPYKLHTWVPDREIELAARHDHFEHRPFIERLRTRVITDLDAQFLELKTGRIDRMTLKPAQYERLIAGTTRLSQRYAAYKHLGNGYVYLGFNLTSPLFADKRVRQALSYATPREALVRGVLMGHGLPIAGPFKPGTWAADDTLAPYPYDLDKAKALLDAAGWSAGADGIRRKNGRKLAFTVVTNQGNEQRLRTAEILQFTFRQIGVEMKIRVQEWATFIENTLNNRQFEAIILGWQLTPEPDPYDIWHSSKTGPREFNVVGFNNPEADRLIEAARATYDQNERKRLYAAFQRILHDEQPYLFLFAPYTLTALHKRFKNIDPAPAGIDHNFIDWYVPLEQRIYPQPVLVP